MMTTLPFLPFSVTTDAASSQALFSPGNVLGGESVTGEASPASDGPLASFSALLKTCVPTVCPEIQCNVPGPRVTPLTPAQIGSVSIVDNDQPSPVSPVAEQPELPADVLIRDANGVIDFEVIAPAAPEQPGHRDVPMECLAEFVVISVQPTIPESTPSSVDEPPAKAEAKNASVPTEENKNVVECGLHAPTENRTATNASVHRYAYEPEKKFAPARSNVSEPNQAAPGSPLVTDKVELSAQQALTKTADVGGHSLRALENAQPPMMNGAGAAPEKIAVDTRNPQGRPRATVVSGSYDKFLVGDIQSDKSELPRHGTVSAKTVSVMPATSATAFNSSAPASMPALSPVAAADGVLLATADLAADAPLPVAHHDADTTQHIALSATDAASVVREVAEITHDFRLRERTSVEVRFNFKDDTDLAVRLTYRDGDVHTTFRTDSSDLRAALGREWQNYAANFAQESRDYRIADPVFTASDSSSASQERDTGAFAGRDGHRQSGSQHDQPNARAFVPHGTSFRGHSSPSASATSPLPAPLSSNRLLHVFA